MSELTIWAFVLLGVFISSLLVRFSLNTWKKIKRIEAEKAQHQEAGKASLVSGAESIKVIAQCMIDKQVELSEGCIRVKVLLDHVAPHLHDEQDYSVFSKMYEAMEHMPTHEARKQADKALIQSLDQQRFKLEEDHQEEIIEAAKAILTYNF